MKVHIQKEFHNDKVTIYVMDESYGSKKNISIRNISESGTEFEFKELSREGGPQKLDPFLQVPTLLFEDLVKAFLDYAQENNIKSENQTFLEGKLVATEKHLEDLRGYFDRLLKK